MFRLVCLDIDGTLVDTSMRISPQVVNALIRLQTRGTLVTLASGRHIFSLREYARLLGTKAPLIAFNGAWIQCYKQDGHKHKRRLGPFLNLSYFFLLIIQARFIHAYPLWLGWLNLLHW